MYMYTRRQSRGIMNMYFDIWEFREQIPNEVHHIIVRKLKTDIQFSNQSALNEVAFVFSAWAPLSTRTPKRCSR